MYIAAYAATIIKSYMYSIRSLRNAKAIVNPMEPDNIAENVVSQRWSVTPEVHGPKIHKLTVYPEGRPLHAPDEPSVNTSVAQCAQTAEVVAAVAMLMLSKRCYSGEQLVTV